MEVALLCKTRKEFYTNYKSAYALSSKNKWLNDICSHMQWTTKPMYYWTKERCQEVALLCESRYNFQKNYGRAYRVSYENKWLDEICKHMKNIGNIFKRLVYLCEFQDGYVYIGITCNKERRLVEHHKDDKSSVYSHTLETGLLPTHKYLTDYISSEEAGEIEKFYINYYKELGFKILNKKEGGGFGGGYRKWNYNSCKEEASKYETKTQFMISKRKAYELSKKENWLVEFFNN